MDLLGPIVGQLSVSYLRVDFLITTLPIDLDMFWDYLILEIVCDVLLCLPAFDVPEPVHEHW